MKESFPCFIIRKLLVESPWQEMEPCDSSHNLLAKGIIKGKTVSLLERKLRGSELTPHTSQRQEVLFAKRRRKKGRSYSREGRRRAKSPKKAASFRKHSFD